MHTPLSLSLLSRARTSKWNLHLGCRCHCHCHRVDVSLCARTRHCSLHLDSLACWQVSLSPPLNECFNHRRTSHWTKAHQDSGKSLSLSLGRRLEHLQTRHNHNSHTCVGKPLSPLDWAVTHMTTGRPLSLTYRGQSLSRGNPCHRHLTAHLHWGCC